MADPHRRVRRAAAGLDPSSDALLGALRALHRGIRSAEAGNTSGRVPAEPLLDQAFLVSMDLTGRQGTCRALTSTQGAKTGVPHAGAQPLDQGTRHELHRAGRDSAGHFAAGAPYSPSGKAAWPRSMAFFRKPARPGAE